MRALRVEHKKAIDRWQVIVQDKDKALASLTGLLDSILKSSGWTLLQTLWNTRLALAPHGSGRERAFLWIKRGVQQIRAKGLFAVLGKLSERSGVSLLGMNRYRHKFVRFQAQRRSAHSADLSSLSCPATPGLVSIVLPAYNGADYIRVSLESILSQTYRHFELIAIDDGSTDDTSFILDEFASKDPRIRVIHQQNRQLPLTLSRGFRLARGEFLTWTSCDNRMKPDFLAKLVSSLRRHPAWDMVYANQDLIDQAGCPCATPFGSKATRTRPEASTSACPQIHPC